MAVAAGFAALLFLIGMVATVPMTSSADGPNPLTVQGHIYDSVGRTVEDAEVTVTLYDGVTPMSEDSEPSDANGYYALTFLPEDWEIGYNIIVVAVYGGNQEDATAVAPDANFIEVDVHFTFEIPEFGAEWGLLVAGIAVGAVAAVALVWRRK
jgi:hypothetical protein